MSDEQNYYTPEHSDIRLLFECEVYDEWNKEWDPVTVDTQSLPLYFYRAVFSPETLRVPFLNKEQIEDMGWIEDDSVGSHIQELYPFSVHYENDQTEWWFRLCYCPDDQAIEIIRFQSNEHKVLYSGCCRCINDLRMIVKLLDIPGFI